VAVAAVIGFTGNELVARYRIRVGQKIGSAALVADGPSYRVRNGTFTAPGEPADLAARRYPQRSQ
jgi:divalent metal cation (Fe/Co/Zn/Cd) transporter